MSFPPIDRAEEFGVQALKLSDWLSCVWFAGDCPRICQSRGFPDGQEDRTMAWKLSVVLAFAIAWLAAPAVRAESDTP